MTKDLWTVEEVARHLHITPRTLHYYEEVGLVSPTARTDGGHRLYSRDATERLEHILHLKGNLSYSLKEIREILDAEDTLDRLKSSYKAASDEEKARILDQSIELMNNLVSTINQKLDNLDVMKRQFTARLENLINARTGLPK